MTGKSFYNAKAGVHLRSLNKEDMELLKRHGNTRQMVLELEGIAARNLEFLSHCARLEELVIYGGKVEDYSALGKLENLRCLFMNGHLRRWLDSFDFLSGVVSLEKLQIMHYPMVATFPNLENCAKLEMVEIFGCMRLKDISNMARIRNLKSVLIGDAPITVSDVEFLAPKQGMAALNASFGNKKMDHEFMEMITRYGIKRWLG